MRVVICEDSVLLREGLARLVADAGHDVVASLPDAERLSDVVVEQAPELVIVDVRMPPTYTDEGIRAALELKRRDARLPIVVLSQYVEERYAADLIGQGGAFGYLLKDRVADVQEFLQSLATVAAGGTVLDPEVVSQLLARKQRDERLASLTPRERTVLTLMAEGRSNAAIAEQLFVSLGAVEKHITAIFTKLGLTQDDDGNRRVLAVLVHLETPGTGSER